MSVIGLDVGNANCVVGFVQEQGIEPHLQYLVSIAQNEESKYETPALISFANNRRLLGSTAALSPLKDPRNIISQIKCLIGLKFDDPKVQKDLMRLPYKVTENPWDGSPLIHVKYCDEETAFTPTQIMAMTLSNLKNIAEKKTKESVKNCVIGIPVYFTHAQRQAYLDAAEIAGLRPLRLMHETVATALEYGIHQRDFQLEHRNVVFVDMGHSSMQVCVVSFMRGRGKILGHGFDSSLGGRDFDAVLFNHFASKFQKENNINVNNSPKASQRLWSTCERLKTILSASSKTPFHIECPMEDKDLSGIITRKSFEMLASPLLNRLQGPCQRALDMAKLTVDEIHSIELVGSGSRIPIIFNILSEFFKKEPSQTMSANESVARGCTLQCAIYNPNFYVRGFQIHDSFPCPIKVSWEDQCLVADRTTSDNLTNVAEIFKTGDIFPNIKIIYFFRSNKFDVGVSYTLEGMDSQRLFRIYPRHPFKAKNSRILVKICLNRHGMVSIESAFPEEDEF